MMIVIVLVINKIVEISCRYLHIHICLLSLKDPKNRLDQQSEEVAQGYYNFANVLCQLKGDLVKAEMLG
jgi:CDP-diacylglycerol pyrophosphatase